MSDRSCLDLRETQIQTTGSGLTMVIDKGLGCHSFTDLLETAGDYIDCIKFGFGTAPLYPNDILISKIELAKRYGLTVMPGGTFLETAIQQNVVPAFFNSVCRIGFNGIEVSDGTIEVTRSQRSELIREGVKLRLRVVTEYGKKLSGSLIDANSLAVTVDEDLSEGADLVTIEARESGKGVGLFDERGDCSEGVLESVTRMLGDCRHIMWETPLKQQQVLMIQTFGSNVNLGNIPPSDILSLETLRRGLRSDTFHLGDQVTPFFYMI
ncbi:phosphosulfolactate synthase [Paenibacillus solisilvae]|uniref:Phosphosulfolactate synthase n=1 Tax=Paenibacillus solisilvae TaxID=2486751 RepID=A0ABW0VZ75_9BACL